MYVEHSSQMENFILLIDYPDSPTLRLLPSISVSDILSSPVLYSKYGTSDKSFTNKHAQVKCLFSSLSTVAISYSSFYLHKPG